jgi:acetyl esterase
VAPPRLSPRVEHRIVRAVCGLPSGAQRILFGTPPTIDGQRLAPDIHALLRLAALTGDTSVTASSSPEEARARNRAGAQALAGPRRPMAAVERLEIPGPGGAIPARLYVPHGLPASPQPLIVHFHGGGWVIGSLDTADGVCRFLSTSVGARVLSVDYRLAPEHPFPAAVEDAFAAFRWAAVRAPELDSDPSRIVLAGDSAGGNLAAATSLLAAALGEHRPAMQLLLYPVTDAVGGQRSRDLFADGFLLTRTDMDWFEAHYLPDESALRDPRVSMLRAADLSGLPPTHVATAGFDPLRDEGELFAVRARAAGVRTVLHRHPGLIHGFANMTAISRTARAAMHGIAAALRADLTSDA